MTRKTILIFLVFILIVLMILLIQKKENTLKELVTPLPMSTPSILSDSTIKSEKNSYLNNEKNKDIDEKTTSSEKGKTAIKNKITYSRETKSLHYLKKTTPVENAKAYVKEISTLEYGEVKQSSVGDSTQFFFPQTISGIPLYPEIGISLIIEGDNQLKAIDGEYIESVHFINKKPMQNESGTKLIIVYDRNNNKVNGRYAFYKMNEGIETIKDASTGEIILTKNRRQY